MESDNNFDDANRQSSNDNGLTFENDHCEIEEEDILQVIPLEEFIFNGEIGDKAEKANNEDDDLTEKIPDDSQCVFRAHSKDVFSIHSFGSLLATGGEDDRAFLWSLNNIQSAKLEEKIEPILSITDHRDSVTFVRFNSKGTLLASGDMSGKIVVIDVCKGEKVAEFHDVSDLEWLQWHLCTDILFAGGADGNIWMWLIATEQGRVYPGPGSACVSGMLFPDGKRLLAGYSDSSVRIWSLKDGVFKAVSGLIDRAGTLGQIISLDVHPTLSIGASGAQNGTVAIFHTDSARITAILNASSPSIDSSHIEDDWNSVETVSFAHSQPWLVTGTNSGVLTFWDLTTNSVARRICRHSDGIVKCQWIDSTTVMSIFLDGIVRIWDGRDGRLIKQMTSDGVQNLDATYNSAYKFIVTANSGGDCRFFQV